MPVPSCCGSCFPPIWPTAPDKTIAESLDPGVIAEWINDDELSRLLFENLSDHDYFPGVLDAPAGNSFEGSAEV